MLFDGLRAARLRRGVLPAVAVLVVLGAGTLVAAVSSRASAPVLTVSPGSGLADGQFVKVSVTGLSPGTPMIFRQCTAAPVNTQANCTPRNTSVLIQADGSGAGASYIAVYSGQQPALQNSNKTGFVTCDQDHPCVLAGLSPGLGIAAGGQPEFDDVAKALTVSVAFDRAPDACPAPPPGVEAISGSGSASAYRAIYKWQSTVCLSPHNLPVVYSVNNSPDGFRDFFAEPPVERDFAAVGPVAATAPTSSKQSYQLAPLAASAVVLAYRIYGREYGPDGSVVGTTQVTNLTLTPELIAQVMSGTVQNFSINPAIKALNPGISFPGRTAVFARAEHSSETYVLSSWLGDAAPARWPTPPSPIYPGGKVSLVTTLDKVGYSVANPFTVVEDQGNIGVMDASTAAFYGLPIVHIKLPDGTIMDPTPASVTKALTDHVTANPDGSFSVDYDQHDPLAYPMPMLSYLAAPTNRIAPARGSVLRQFLQYAVGDGQKVLPAGYVPLPSRLVAAALKVADLIPVPLPVPGTAPRGAGGPPSDTGALPATPPDSATAPPLGGASSGAFPSASPPDPSLIHRVAKPAASACPSPRASPPAAVVPTAATSPSASASPRAALSGSATPSASPAATARSAAKCPAAGTLSAVVRLQDGQGAELRALLGLEDASGAHLILPSIVGLAVVGLSGGLVLLVASRLRA